MAKWSTRTPVTAKKLDYMLRKYKELTSDLNVERIVTPSNLEFEKKKWISAARVGIFNTPTFTYNERLLREVVTKKPELEELKKMVMGDTTCLEPEDRTIADLLANRIEDALLTIELAESILHRDDVTSAKISKEKFGVPSSQMFSRATEFANSMKSKNQDASKQFLKTGESLFSEEEMDKLQNLRLDSGAVVKALEKVLRSGEYRNWKVVTGPQQAPKILGREIIIPESFHITPFRLAMYVSRTVDCWMTREANAEQYLREIGTNAFKTDDDLLVEGLEAFFNIDLELRAFGKAAKMPAPFVVLAINQALHGRSFRTVGEEMYNLRLETGLKDSDAVAKAAWTITYKTFRGVTNTLNSGAYAFCKDRAQFEGYHMVKDLISRRDRRAREWLSLGFYDRNDIDYLCQHNNTPMPIFRRRDLGIEVARSFL